jgi:hypothetical protein
MIKGKRILCDNVKGFLKDTTYYISFKVAYSDAKWVAESGILIDIKFGVLFV